MTTYEITNEDRGRLIDLLVEHFTLPDFQTFVLDLGGEDEISALGRDYGLRELVTRFVARRGKAHDIDRRLFKRWRDLKPKHASTIDAFEECLALRPNVTDTGSLGDSVRKRIGNPDLMRLICKVSGAAFVKSTKAMEVPGGCLVQVSTREQNRNGLFAVAEAMSFVPGVRLVANPDGESWRFVADGEDS